MSFIKQILAGGLSKTIDSIGDAVDKISTTKEEKMNLQNEIRKAEMNYEIEMQKIGYETEKLSYDDRDSARRRESEVQTSENATRLSKNITVYLAILSTVLCFSLFFCLLFFENIIKESTKDIAIYILGVLSTLLTQIYSYYFGSSQGSQDKNKMLEGKIKN